MRSTSTSSRCAARRLRGGYAAARAAHPTLLLTCCCLARVPLHPLAQAKHLSDRKGDKLHPSAGAHARFVGDPVVTISSTMSNPSNDQHTSIVAGSCQPR